MARVARRTHLPGCPAPHLTLSWPLPAHMRDQHRPENPVLSLILSLAAASGATPVTDDGAAVVFMQSRLVPASFQVCAEAFPDAARAYEAAMAAWTRKHQPTIQRGETHARKSLQQQGEDLDTVLATERTRLMEEIRSMSDTERANMCARMLDTTRAES